jgi:hypothetical protein
MLASVPLVAQQLTCPPQTSTPKAMEDCLSRTFGERLIWQGVRFDGRVHELYASLEGNTWTFVLMEPSGTTHVVTSGVGMTFPFRMAPDVVAVGP